MVGTLAAQAEMIWPIERPLLESLGTYPRSPSRPCTRSSWSTTAMGSLPILQVQVG